MPLMAARAVVRMDWEACVVPCPTIAVDELALNVNSHVRGQGTGADTVQV